MNEQKPPYTPDRVKTGEKPPFFPLRFFLPRYMVPDEKKRGDDFGTKQIYRTFLLLAWPALAEQVLTGVSVCGTKSSNLPTTGVLSEYMSWSPVV